MGKITVIIDDDIEEWVRNYVTQNYPQKPFGKLSEVVNKALKDFMEKHRKT